jgi:PAS domain S-box-containing protein
MISEDRRSSGPPERAAARKSRGLVVWYVVVAGAWVTFSHHLFEHTPLGALPAVAYLRGPFYLAVTTALLYWLIYRHTLAMEQLRAAAEHREREVRATFDLSSSIMLRTDRGGRITRLNGFAASFFGKREEDLLGTPIDDLIRGETIDGLQEVAERIRRARSERDGTTQHETESTRAHGHRVAILWRHTPVMDADGNAVGVVSVGNDITELKRAEQARQESDAMFRAIFEHSPMAIVVNRTRDGTFVAVNPTFLRTIGRAEGDVIGKTSVDVGVQESAAAQEAVGTLLRAGGRIDAALVRGRGPDGDVIHGLFSSVAIRVADELLALSMGIDVTDRVRAEDALRASQAMLARIINAIPQGVFWKDTAGVYQGCNESFAKFAGARSREDVIGKNDDLLPWSKADADKHAADDREVQRSAQPRYHVLEALRRVDGTDLWVSTTKIPLTDTDGRVVGILGIWDDVTEQKQDEDRRRVDERRLSMAVSAAADAVWEYDVMTGRMYCSPRWYAMLGYEDKTCATTYESWRQLCHPEDLASRDERVASVLAGKDSPGYQVDIRMKAADGSWRWILARGNVVERDADGKPRLVAGTSTDITEKKRAEETEARLQSQLREAQKLEALGTLAGGVAHDFNNLLAAIIGYTEAAFEAVGDRPRAQSDLAQVLKACARATDLTRQVLAFGRRARHDRGPVQLGDVVTEVATLLRSTLPAAVELETTVPADLPLVLADASQMHQVVMNLATNGAHAMRPHGGHLAIGLETREVREGSADSHLELRPGPHVKLTVRDTGHGMGPDILGRVFEPFFTTKKPGEGTGLGLSVVHGIVREHQGGICVESEQGRGSLFSVYLPALLAKEELPERATGELARGAHQRILVVDDEEALCVLLGRMLENLGYRPTVLSAPHKALAVFRECPQDFDLLITDLNMPGMGGLDLASAVAAVRPGFPVLVTTGYPGAVTAEVAREHGVVDIIPKPVSLMRLSQDVRAALELSRRAI